MMFKFQISNVGKFYFLLVHCMKVSYKIKFDILISTKTLQGVYTDLTPLVKLELAPWCSCYAIFIFRELDPQSDFFHNLLNKEIFNFLL